MVRYTVSEPFGTKLSIWYGGGHLLKDTVVFVGTSGMHGKNSPEKEKIAVIIN